METFLGLVSRGPTFLEADAVAPPRPGGQQCQQWKFLEFVSDGRCRRLVSHNRTHQLILELHEQFHRVILSTEPRNPLVGCGADTEQRGSGKRERGANRQGTERYECTEGR